MKRRTVRAAKKRADKPGGKSQYAKKHAAQKRGVFSLRSPFYGWGNASPPPAWALPPTTYLQR